MECRVIHGRCIGIWNAHASKAQHAQDVLARLDGLCDEVLHPKSREETIQAIRRMRNVRRLIVAGGDGSINAAVNALAPLAHPPQLGLIPLGTANDLSASLAIPDNPYEAIKLIEHGQVVPVDLIQVLTEHRDAWCINMATGGNSARVTEHLTEELKERWGPLVYLRGVIGVLSDLDVFRTTIQFDDEPAQVLDVWNILLANAQTCGGRIHVAPRANPTDGLIDVIVVRDGTVGDMAEMAAGLVIGNYLQHEQVLYRQVRRVELRSAPPMRFTIDGELVDEIPNAFVVHLKKLPVIVGTLHTECPPTTA